MSSPVLPPFEIRGKTEKEEGEAILKELETIKGEHGPLTQPDENILKQVEAHLMELNSMVVKIYNYLPVDVSGTGFRNLKSGHKFLPRITSEVIMPMREEFILHSNDCNHGKAQLKFKIGELPYELVLQLDRRHPSVYLNDPWSTKLPSDSNSYRVSHVFKVGDEQGHQIQLVKQGSVRVALNKSVSALGKIFLTLEFGSTLEPVIWKLNHSVMFPTLDFLKFFGLFKGAETRLEGPALSSFEYGVVVDICNYLPYDLVGLEHYPAFQGDGTKVDVGILPMRRKNFIFKGPKEGLIKFNVDLTDFGIAIAFGAQLGMNYYGIAFVRSDVKCDAALLHNFIHDSNSKDLGDWKFMMANNKEVEIETRNVFVRSVMTTDNVAKIQIFIAAF